jgi:hypothetical protein
MIQFPNKGRPGDPDTNGSIEAPSCGERNRPSRLLSFVAKQREQEFERDFHPSDTSQAMNGGVSSDQEKFLRGLEVFVHSPTFPKSYGGIGVGVETNPGAFDAHKELIPRVLVKAEYGKNPATEEESLFVTVSDGRKNRFAPQRLFSGGVIRAKNGEERLSLLSDFLDTRSKDAILQYLSSEDASR